MPFDPPSSLRAAFTFSRRRFLECSLASLFRFVPVFDLLFPLELGFVFFAFAISEVPGASASG